MAATPLSDIPPGRLVVAEIDGAAVVCLAARREARDYTNFYLVPVEEGGDRAALALVYADPDRTVEVLTGAALAFEPAGDGAPGVGDAFAHPAGPQIKLLDDPRAQKLFAYVNAVDGAVRGRMEARAEGLLSWRLVRGG